MNHLRHKMLVIVYAADPGVEVLVKLCAKLAEASVNLANHAENHANLCARLCASPAELDAEELVVSEYNLKKLK